MKKLVLLSLILALAGCQTLKNGVAEPKNIHAYEPTRPDTTIHVSHAVLQPWQKQLENPIIRPKIDTSAKLPVSLRTYTIPVPTKK